MITAEIEEATETTVLRQATGVLKVRLGSCLTGPTKRLAADLHETAHACQVARNAMIRAWLRWREDHEDWLPPPVLDADGNPRFYRDGTPMLRSPIMPEDLDYPPFAVPARPRKKRKGSKREAGKIGFETWLYHHGAHRSPRLHSQILPMLASEVAELLKAKTPYNHPGQARFRWQAILQNEISVPSFREATIPVPNNYSVLVYGKDASPSLRKLPEEVREAVLACGANSCVVCFPLFGSKADRLIHSPIVRLEARQLKGGHRTILHKIAEGAWKFSDSKMVYHDQEGWFLHLVYQQPVLASGLIATRVATLALLPKEERNPLAVSCKIEEYEPRWEVGRGQQLQAYHDRLASRREAIHRSYRLSGSGRREHGRRRALRDTRKATRAISRISQNIMRQTVAEIVRFCERYHCAELHFPEPSMGERSRSWFAGRDLPWDWTIFIARLKHRCERAGIIFDDE